MRKGLKCPLNARNQCEQCLWYLEFTKQNEHKLYTEKKCAMAWLPELMIENSRVTHSGVAATESFRNEMVRGNGQLAQVLLAGLNDEQKRIANAD